MLRIGLDLDNTLCEFWQAYIDRFGTPKNDYVITKNVYQKLRTDKDFWVNLEVINRIDFEPTLYCTKRVNPKSYTKQWLHNNGFPKAPIYQVIIQSRNKATMIKGKVDVFIDDSIQNFIQLNLAGVPCLLIDSPQNQSWGPIGRIHSLNYNDILASYELFMEYNFHEFYKYV